MMTVLAVTFSEINVFKMDNISRIELDNKKLNNMKKLAYYVFLSFVLFSCNKDKVNDNSLKELKIDDIRSQLPLTEIGNNPEAIYYNESGVEKTFEIEINSEVIDKSLNGEKYRAEQLTIEYSNQIEGEFSMYIRGTGDYTDDRNTNLYIKTSLVQFETTYSPTMTIDENGNPLLATFYKEIKIVDRTFENAYSNLILPTISSFSELYFNSQFGIIGFKDQAGSLFVLKEYK